MQIEYNEVSCTNWFTKIEGGTTKEVILAYIDILEKDNKLEDLAKLLAENYGECDYDFISCDDCGHSPYKVVLKFEELKKWK